MLESEFIALIDGCFPYEKPIRWRQLSAKATRISSNAAFMVLHEVCRPPRSVELAPRQTELIAKHLQQRFRHPAMRAIYPAVRAHIHGKKLRASKAAHLMRKLAACRNEFNALAICYFSAYDRDGQLERTYEQIASGWKSKN